MKQVLLIEDDGSRFNRRPIVGVTEASSNTIFMRLHEVNSNTIYLLGEQVYNSSISKQKPLGRRAAIALDLLSRIPSSPEDRLVVAGSEYGRNQQLIKNLLEQGYEFLFHIQPSARVKAAHADFSVPTTIGSINSALFKSLCWVEFCIKEPVKQRSIKYSAAELCKVILPSERLGRLIVAQRGGIEGVHASTVFVLTSIIEGELKDLLEIAGWARWVRSVTRHQERIQRIAEAKKTSVEAEVTELSRFIEISARANITLSEQQDQTAAWKMEENTPASPRFKGLLGKGNKTLNLMELYAGAGAMGLGFLMAEQQKYFKLFFSGEVHPVYVETLKYNHRVFKQLFKPNISDVIPKEIKPLDLRTRKALETAESAIKQAGGIHILIGGPPCQGFSSANRNSWYSENPYNQHIHTFLTYVEKLKPLVFLMENVQGILWTPKYNELNAEISVAHWVKERMSKAGYLVFPKLLDAVWYGVPQYRSRFFMLGIHESLGYCKEDFGLWGPFPRPTHGPGTSQEHVTVQDAISDLPRVGNGCLEEELAYDAPEEFGRNHFLQFIRQGAVETVIHDHVTSQHSEYVIERYRQIPPGGNWKDIVDSLTNYADVERTHSNIYRRLELGKPSITMGHYRKSMIVHPSQHRGLSLREATRIQSIPDWFRFAGNAQGVGMGRGGLTHKQQQLANAVCPLVSKAIAEFILQL